MKWVMLVFVLCSCTAHTSQQLKDSNVVPPTAWLAEMDPLPIHIGPVPGRAVSISEDESAPFDGVLLDKEKAIAAAELRVAYDEIYRISEIQQATFEITQGILVQELQDADREIEKKNEIIDELKNSWWSQHKMTVGIIGGVVLGVVGSMGAGWVWSQIDE